MPTLTLRQESASAFSTKGSALTFEEMDNNFIQLKAEIDTLSDTLAAVGGHTQNTDTYLDFGGGNQVAASDIKALIDDYPVVSGSDDDQLYVNAAGTAFEVRSKAYAFYYMNANSTSTTISASGTLTDIAGSLTEDISSGFSAAGGTAISNDTGRDIVAKISIMASINPAAHAGDHEWNIGLAINGVDEPSEMQAYNSGGGNDFQIAWHAIVSIPDGHIIQPRISNETDTDNITVEYLQISIEALN